MGRFQAVIFDKDGTLLDTEKHYQQGWYVAAKRMGISLTKEMIVSLYGRSGKDQVESFHKVCPQVDAQTFCDLSLDYAHEQCAKQIELKPGTIELLNWLKKQSIPCACASGGPMPVIVHDLTQTNLIDYFSVLVSGQQVPKGKPDPDIFIETCRQLDMKSDQCVVIEDSPNGILAANAAGCQSIMVPEKELFKDMAHETYDECFNNLNEVEAFLRRQLDENNL